MPEHVGKALGQDDGCRPRHRDIVGLLQDERFEDLAHLAGGDREDEPREEGEQAIELGHSLDAEARQVVLPLEKSREVVAEGERAREPEGRPREPP